MTAQSWERYPNGKAPFEQPPTERNGVTINHDLLSGTLDQVRETALEVYEREHQAQEAQERAEAYRQIDEIYSTVNMYVDLLEATGWPGGRMLKIIPDGIDPENSKESDVIDGVLWRLTDHSYNNSALPHLAVGPDRRIYNLWRWGTDEKNKTYTRGAFAPRNLYDKAYWSDINDIQAALDTLEIPVESNLEIPPADAFDRNGIDLPVGIDIDQIRADTLAAYNREQDAAKWVEIKPTVEQIDAIYQDAQLLAGLWRESDMPGAIKCSILPDVYIPDSTADQRIDAAVLPLYDSQETSIKGAPGYVLGPEGRIYSMWMRGYDQAARTATCYFYAPLDLYAAENNFRAARVARMLDAASKATH